jgi:hypothetical protein
MVSISASGRIPKRLSFAAAASALFAFFPMGAASLPGDSFGAQAPAETESIRAVNRSLSLSYRRSNLYYIEPTGSCAIPNNCTSFPNGYSSYQDSEAGSINGFKVAASWMGGADTWWDNPYVYVGWSWVNGRVSYAGFDQNNNPVYGLQSRATVQDYTLRLGKGFATGKNVMLTPYLGLGGHSWTREIGLGSSAQTSPIGNHESYSHAYAGAGSLIQYAFLRRWIVTGNALIGKTFWAQMSAEPQIDRAALGASLLIDLGLEFDFAAYKALHLLVGVDYMNYSYGQSGVFVVNNGNNAVMEPSSRTEVYAFDVGVRFAY